jgi:hypothetical protein
VHYRALVRLAAVLVRDARTAEEVVQDSFAAMHGGWQRLRDGDAALAYLRQAVVNRSRSVLRHRSVPGSNLQQVPPGVFRGEHQARVLRVARALTAVGALDDEIAEQILGDFELALAIRQAGSPGRRSPGLGSSMRSPAVRPRPAMPVSSRPPASGMPAAARPGTGATGGPADAPGSAAGAIYRFCASPALPADRPCLASAVHRQRQPGSLDVIGGGHVASGVPGSAGAGRGGRPAGLSARHRDSLQA